MSTHDGGPAFPQISYQRVGDMEIGETDGGMTLRDYFAGQALAGFCATGLKAGNGPAGFASTAYEMADAMLRERDK